ncbi:conserved hypothetical protein [Hyphomonas neptunium ATCC 15444]|uniref:XRE family transcriptional regulator n=2 Tax=Hyphomonas TaxID=85 RepID=Q0BZ71_HYPNA|nr:MULTISPECIES: hypothetical protein [Hyphomonas]ABI77287.1 conserved hypothetical protein [Hyphomonas neptunium ATCC 15444]KCZ95311.1 hypothetical protein HHI_06559 [Hyphomonas hirschiana VP5]
MSFPKEGKFFPPGDGAGIEHRYAAEIAGALNRSLGANRARIKTAVAWTGANERTVKNWFSGKYGPSGEHLIGLMRHSDDVLEIVLELSGRSVLLHTVRADRAEQLLRELMVVLRMDT